MVITHEVPLNGRVFSIESFMAETAELNLQLLGENEQRAPHDETRHFYIFKFCDEATTIVLEQTGDKQIALLMDGFASHTQYALWPNLIVALHTTLGEEDYILPESEYGEGWEIEAQVNTVAHLKAYLNAGFSYPLDLPMFPGTYLSNEVLEKVGVSVDSSSMRLLNYVRLLLEKKALPEASPEEYQQMIAALQSVEGELSVPPHIPAKITHDYDTDGTPTSNSFSQTDALLLLNIGQDYKSGQQEVLGQVLNDIGLLYSEGIGIEKDGAEAVYWFKQAILQGDFEYAPCNLGDLYRRGLPPIEIDLCRAAASFFRGDNPYCIYRLGQALEEGWFCPPNMDWAKCLYVLAAAEEHHLALKRCEELHIDVEENYAAAAKQITTVLMGTQELLQEFM